MKLSRTKEKREREGNHDRTCASEMELWKRKGFCILHSPTGGEMGLKRGGSLEPLKVARIHKRTVQKRYS